MSEGTDYLLDWAYQFLRSKDAVFRKIRSIEKEEGYLHITYADKEVLVYSALYLSELYDMLGDGHQTFVVYQLRDNLDYLLSQWDTFSEYPGLTIYFVNPFSSGQHSWVIRPWMHNRVAEHSSLRQGLQSMFENVEEVDPERVDELARNQAHAS